MLKLILKLVVYVVTVILLAILLTRLIYDEQKNINFVLTMVIALVTAFGTMVLLSIEIMDYSKSRREAEVSNSAARKKRLRAIHDDFRLNYASTLIKLNIIGDKSELTLERIYKLSQDSHVISLLSQQAPGIRDALEEFAKLHKQSANPIS